MKRVRFTEDQIIAVLREPEAGAARARLYGRSAFRRSSASPWSRFERAVDVVAKSPPQHRTKVKVDWDRPLWSESKEN